MEEEDRSFNDEHEAFAASRVSQFVYVPTKDSYFTAFEQHADTLDGDVKPPLVLVGDEGSGKSALIANWVAKRREHKHRDEFLFQHFVGCTTPSLQLSSMLQRLESTLKDFFQLREMKVPDTEEELRWALNRFLAAAAKKHFPARIVIIIDGVHRLKHENGPDGALHWLPTELPPCVRFIVSTVQFERSPKLFSGAQSPHRTFVELQRRQCPQLQLEPLLIPTINSIINAYTALDAANAALLTEGQQFKIVTYHAVTQPMFLRSILQSLTLGAALTNLNVDQMLDLFLTCTTSHDVINACLNICCKALFPETAGDQDAALAVNARAQVFDKIFAMTYASRNGLTVEEIWEIIKMFMKDVPPEPLQRKILVVFKKFTMVVNGMHSFSHEVFREVTYSKYICTKEALNRWHYLIARYFGQLPPCARKLVALPYHLQEAGAWSKVKNCLADIEMFQLWWQPEFKSDFIKFWSSLTRVHRGNKGEGENNNSNNNNNNNNSSVGNNNNNSNNGDLNGTANDNSTAVGGGKKPTYDIVDEYVKSLDEYRYQKHPSDEAVANIILEIADFMLEFATLGHEANADVPALVHPYIPPEDLRAIGVPYITVDSDGRSTVHYPEIFHKAENADDGVGNAEAGATKAIDELPVCTSYFYHRWMWIQFPYIALGNCDVRYQKGVTAKIEYDGGKKQRNVDMDTAAVPSSRASNRFRTRLKAATGANENGADKSWNLNAFKLPQITFTRKVARSHRRVPADEGSDPTVAPVDKVTQRLVALQDDISNYREEHDFIVQMKNALVKRLAELKGSLVDLKRSAESCNDFAQQLAKAEERETDAAQKCESCKFLHRNLINLNAMCERHPANVPALNEELQAKSDLDAYLITEMKKRLWEQKFEFQMHQIYYRKMQGLVKEGLDMHSQLLSYRLTMKKGLTSQQIEDEKRMKLAQELQQSSTGPGGTGGRSSGTPGGRHGSGPLSSRVAGKSRGKDKHGQPGVGGSGDGSGLLGSPVRTQQSWEDIWQVITSRTGIPEPEIFFQRINNGKVLEEQINTIKKASETRLDFLKKEMIQVESELEESRYDASISGGLSTKEKTKELTDKQFAMRHIKERAEAAEQLQQRVTSGLVHLGEMLGVPPKEEDCSIADLQRDIETLFDLILEEREKQQSTPHGTVDHTRSQASAATPASPETHHRSPELESILYKYEHIVVRKPLKLASKPEDDVGEDPGRAAADEADDDEEGTWDRLFVKTQSQKNVKSELKKASRQPKSPNLNATI